MPVARILCGVTLHVELWAESDSSDARLALEAKALTNATKKKASIAAQYTSADAADGTSSSISLDNDPQPLDKENYGTTKDRPIFVLPNVAPLSWDVEFNSFRRADEFDCTLPLALLPVPLDAVRSISCEVAIDAITDEAWADAMAGGASPIPTLAINAAGTVNYQDVDFAGVCVKATQSVSSGDALPTIRLKFVDYMGLLAGRKVEAGHELRQTGPVTKAISTFLAGTAAEGLEVVWTDTDHPEPTFVKVMPEAKKRKKGKHTPKTQYGKLSLLDVIVEACGLLGIVPRVNVGRIELAYAGTMYQGKDRGGDAKATILVGVIIESFTADHDLLGVKTQHIQVCSYNPDTHQLYTGRWPPDPKSVAPKTLKPGDPPLAIPLAANVGLPGYEQLDESVIMVPVPPVVDASVLPKMAEAIFLERNRQKMRYTLHTHSPWSDPARALVTKADILKLRAGDNVIFGFLPADANEQAQALLPPSLRVISGDVSAAGIQALLMQTGVRSDIAKAAADAIAKVPRHSRWRVDELKISGGEKQDAEIEIKLVNFTVVTGDLEAKAAGQNPDDVVKDATSSAAALSVATVDQIKAFFASKRTQIDDSGASEAAKAAAKAKLDLYERQLMQGR